MRLLDRYLGRELIVSTLFAVLTLSLVLVLGQIFKQLFKFVVDHNVPATYIITFIAYFLPLSLILSIPWGFLTAVLLVFGRLSGSNEFTAMRTAGISTWRIARPILVLSVLFSLLCLWINLYVAPQAQQSLKNAFFEVATTNPAAAFTGDKVINDFPGKKIYVGDEQGSVLQNIHVFSLNPQNKPMQVVYARTGRLETDLANKQIKMRLENSRFEQRDNNSPDDLTKIQPATMGDFVFPISLEELYAQKQGRKKVEAYSYDELKTDLQRKRDQLVKDTQSYQQQPDVNNKRMVRNSTSAVASAQTELNKRFSYSLACFTFALIGIPLGITAQRQETSAGFGLGLVVAFTYFLIIIVVNTFRDKANVHPELLIWLPNVVFLVLGGWLFVRLTRR